MVDSGSESEKDSQERALWTLLESVEHELIAQQQKGEQLKQALLELREKTAGVLQLAERSLALATGMDDVATRAKPERREGWEFIENHVGFSPDLFDLLVRTAVAVVEKRSDAALTVGGIRLARKVFAQIPPTLYAPLRLSGAAHFFAIGFTGPCQKLLPCTAEILCEILLSLQDLLMEKGISLDFSPPLGSPAKHPEHLSVFGAGPRIGIVLLAGETLCADLLFW